MHSDDDIQYALETTRVIHEPDRRIDTFGNTKFEFFIISELLDKVNVIRVRNGKIEAQKPLIIRPDLSDDFQLEGFGEEAREFAGWMRSKIKDFALFKYGFQFRRLDVTESIVHDPFETVCGRITDQVRSSGNPMQVVIQGVDDAWEICLLKFTVELIAKSHGMNLFDFKRRGLI